MINYLTQACLVLSFEEARKLINCIAELGNFRSGWLAPSIHFEEDKLCPDAIPLRLCDILDICYIQSKGGFVTVPGKEQNDKREKH